MKIAVTSKGTDLESEVDPRFGSNGPRRGRSKALFREKALCRVQDLRSRVLRGHFSTSFFI